MFWYLNCTSIKLFLKKREEHRLGDRRGRAPVPVPRLPWPGQVALGLSVLIICDMELLAERWDLRSCALSTGMGGPEGH